MFFAGVSTCMPGVIFPTRVLHLCDRGHCFLGMLNLHDLECQCKNDLRRNDDLGLHHCSNDLSDTACGEQIWNASVYKRGLAP
jgi:hypothetical protein